MKKSLFRISNRIELMTSYIICFGVCLLFQYLKDLKFKSSLLETYFRQIYDFRLIILLILSLMILAFHYRMIVGMKAEIYCRIVIGDTLEAILKRNMVENVLLLTIAFSIISFLGIIFNLQSIDCLYLVFVFITYILISERMLRKYENI